MNNKQRIKTYELNESNINSGYFHFTSKHHLENITINGLLPKIGNHAKLIEKTPKVFFVAGLNNLLILFDSWINVYKKVPINSITHKAGSQLMKAKWFPKFVVDLYFQLIKNSASHKRNAYKVFDELLDNSVLLKLDLIEGIDFVINDIDEIKVSDFSKKHLVTLGYSRAYSNINSPIMDRWNMHTLSNIGVSNDKIKLCNINNSPKIIDILLFSLEKSSLDLEKICPTLYDYLIDRNYIH